MIFLLIIFNRSIKPITALKRGDCSSVGRALGCDPSCRGFKSRQSPHFYLITLRSSLSVGLRNNKNNIFLFIFACIRQESHLETSFLKCGYGGIGRRTGFRYQRLWPWGFKSLYPHHLPKIITNIVYFTFSCAFRAFFALLTW